MNVIIEPIDHYIIDPESIDSIAAGILDAKEKIEKLSDFLSRLKYAASQLATSDERTQYLIGKKYKIKYVTPAPYPNNSMLKEAWNSDDVSPEIRDEYLRVDKVAVNKRAFKKAVKANIQDDGLRMLINKITTALETGSEASPQLSVEIVDSSNSD